MKIHLSTIPCFLYHSVGNIIYYPYDKIKTVMLRAFQFLREFFQNKPKPIEAPVVVSTDRVEQKTVNEQLPTPPHLVVPVETPAPPITRCTVIAEPTSDPVVASQSSSSSGSDSIASPVEIAAPDPAPAIIVVQTTAQPSPQVQVDSLHQRTVTPSDTSSVDGWLVT